MKTRRPTTITFDRGELGSIQVPPLTRAQTRAAYALGSCADLSPEQEFAWRGRLLAIYLEHARCKGRAGAVQTVEEAIESLTVEEEIDIIQGITAAQHGHDPADAVALQQAMRDILAAQKKSPVAETPTPTGS